eukprot:CAMPEP_0116849238 /NCGR_PEP_ID=MMETSP0418-20121206/15457_1 /TAXON_ID=1158023 /ORGANISM="Astrosyne radiata, Strain 13vi08-1A" /LENGTH=206 /DNA_ID=CAMNT_0004480929 /DNA_START=105 /DNA_END=722 /DNA_ORIENTATION=-
MVTVNNAEDSGCIDSTRTSLDLGLDHADGRLVVVNVSRDSNVSTTHRPLLQFLLRYVVFQSKGGRKQIVVARVQMDPRQPGESTERMGIESIRTQGTGYDIHPHGQVHANGRIRHDENGRTHLHLQTDYTPDMREFRGRRHQPEEKGQKRIGQDRCRQTPPCLVWTFRNSVRCCHDSRKTYASCPQPCAGLTRDIPLLPAHAASLW